MTQEHRSLLCRAVGLLAAISEDGFDEIYRQMAQRLVNEFTEVEHAKENAQQADSRITDSVSVAGVFVG